jgi:hypothetical protein
MLRPNRRPSHSNGAEDLNGSNSSLDLNYGNAGNIPSYNYGGGGGAPLYQAGLNAASSFGGVRMPASSSSSNNYSIYKDKPAKQSGSAAVIASILAFAKQPIAWASLLAVLLLINNVSYRSKVNSVLREVNVASIQQARDAYTKLQSSKLQLERDQARTKSQERQSTQKYTDLDRTLKVVQRERDDLTRKLKATQEHSASLLQQQEQQPLVSTLTSSKEQAYKDLIHSLQASVQRESRRAVLEKFGAPPHRVHITVKLPSNLNEPKRFTIELAPLEFMPHSVHLFLEQVAHGLWNGNSFFYVNGPHVIQCGPQATLKEGEVMATPGEERQKALAPFQRVQLDGLAFPEYSDQYTHLPWTLGFTGRPGGPDWYINKVRFKVHLKDSCSVE